MPGMTDAFDYQPVGISNPRGVSLEAADTVATIGRDPSTARRPSAVSGFNPINWVDPWSVPNPEWAGWQGASVTDSGSAGAEPPRYLSQLGYESDYADSPDRGNRDIGSLLAGQGINTRFTGGSGVQYVTGAEASRMGLDPNQQYMMVHQTDPRATGAGNRTQARVLYQRDPSSGQAVPVWASDGFEGADPSAAMRRGLITVGGIALGGLGADYLMGANGLGSEVAGSGLAEAGGTGAVSSPVYSPGLANATNLGALESAGTAGVGGAGVGGAGGGATPGMASAGGAAPAAAGVPGGYTTAAADSALVGSSGAPIAPNGVTLANAGGTMATTPSLLERATGLISQNPRLAGQLGSIVGSAVGAGSPPGVDPSVGGAINRNASIAERQQQLAELQYADQRALMEQYAPLLRQQFEQTLADQRTTSQRADQQWQSYLTNFQPLETRMASTAAGYDTPERRAAAARDAGVAVSDRFAAARDSQAAGLSAAGIAPGSGKALALDAASRIEEAKAVAGASTGARRDIENTGIGLVSDAARFGRNLPSTGLQATQVAGQQGAQAGNQYTGLVSATGNPYQLAAPLLNYAVGANQSSGSLGLGQTQGQQNQWQNRAGLIGDVLGAGLTAWGYFSSEKLKDMGPEVTDALKAVKASPAKHWRYKAGGTAEMGPTAEAFAEATGLGDGTKISIPSHLGLHHAAISELADSMEGLAREVRGLKGRSANDDRPGLQSVKRRA